MTVIAVLATNLSFGPSMLALRQQPNSLRCAQAGAIWSTKAGLADYRCRQTTPWQSM